MVVPFILAAPYYFVEGFGVNREDILKHLEGLTEFERAVLLATLEIPRGKVSTYKRIAERIGRPRAYRAVGNALHKNPIPPTIPCHRVVRSDGGFGGDRKGAEARMRLLMEEGIEIDERGRVKLTEDILF